MNPYILILWLMSPSMGATNAYAIATAEFRHEATCQEALAKVKQRNMRLDGVCVQK